MMRWLRRFFWLGVLSAGGYACYRSWVQRQALSAAPSAADTAVTAPRDPARWVATDDGRCPEGYPVKANDNSGIYHVPGGRFYDRTVPERCYANIEDATADGYRPARA